MKLLLTDPSAEPGPTTLLVWLGHPENGRLEAIAGEPVASGVVAEVGWHAVGKAIDLAWDHRGVDRSHRVEDAIEDSVRSTARLLLPFEADSPVHVLWESDDRLALDLSGATRIDPVPGLSVGDRIVVAIPAEKHLVNIRGRVLSVDDVLAWVEMDGHDLRRVFRSESEIHLSARESFRRDSLEYAERSAWRRRLGRWIWRLSRRRPRLPRQAGEADEPWLL